MKINKTLSTSLKILISIGFLILVFTQLEFKEIKQTFKQVRFIYIILALLFFVASQVISVFRLGECFKIINVNISTLNNAKLYLLGMFYNFFIPGGIGGDAYKVFLLNKQFGNSVKTLTGSLFIDRLFGLIAIGIWFLILCFFVPLPFFENSLLKSIIVIICLVVGITFSFYFIKKWFRKYSSIFIKLLLYSIFIQALQIICIYLILKALHIETNILIYLLLFLVSSVTSIISFAGIGSREAIFFYGAKYFSFNPTVSTSIGLCFSLITLIVSFLGIIYVIKPIKLGLKQNIQ